MFEYLTKTGRFWRGILRKKMESKSRGGRYFSDKLEAKTLRLSGGGGLKCAFYASLSRWEGTEKLRRKT